MDRDIFSRNRRKGCAITNVDRIIIYCHLYKENVGPLDFQTSHYLIVNPTLYVFFNEKKPN